MVGSALVRRLQNLDESDLVLRSHAELDLGSQSQTEAFFAAEQIDEVYLAAARVGGIKANDTCPADFLYQNIVIEANVIHAAWRAGVQKLLFLGSSCIYPRLADQPMRENSLLTGPLELTNEPYAIAKIAGIKLCESYNRQYGVDYRSVMPTNLYGPGDNFDLESSHVLAALLRRFHQAVLDGSNIVTVWGSGKPKREFLHVDDMAAACEFVMHTEHDSYWSEAQPRCSHLNVGTGIDVSIRDLAEMIAELTGFNGRIEFDSQMPDGTPRKLLDVSKLARLGWQAGIHLDDGLKSTYNWMLENWQDISA
jgi:GDP-L-fucose synthase